jgi:hypothetical protein
MGQFRDHRRPFAHAPEASLNMMFGFKRQFEPFVLDGSKTHTIRAKRKRPPRPGDRLDLYGDPRQKTMHLLGRHPCTKIDDVRIELHVPYEILREPIHLLKHFAEYPWIFRVWINGSELDRDERNALAWADGFRGSGRQPFAEMCDFWIKNYGKSKKPLRFSGDMIHWNPTVSMPVRTRAAQAKRAAL